ncbi:unnamed protein product [Angiostrongylus costaricensis]|uniref:Col_cuticle_N domain-containing protein n=1 Tax=Angiostrongylus costaricensis TaxID=334426 RepID=A0A158PMA8_ANGCS|nr:unnamed protein product [Angiostrongylus costaricensis]
MMSNVYLTEEQPPPKNPPPMNDSLTWNTMTKTQSDLIEATTPWTESYIDKNRTVRRESIHTATKMRRHNVKGLERSSISKSDITQNTMPYPNSIRLDPIRLPRPTILRESPIFDIGHNVNTVSSSRGVIRAQVTPSYGPFTFPEHLRTRRLDDININPANDESLTRATSFVSAIDVHQVVTNQVPLESLEERNDQVHTLQITPQIIPRVSPVAQPTPETQHTMKARALCSNPHLGYQRIVFLLAKYPADTFKWQYVKNTTSYYSNEERATHQAILAGGGGMTVLLALATFIYGGIGLNLMERRLANEYEKETRLSAYENQAFQY